MTIDLDDPLSELEGRRARFGFDVDRTVPDLAVVPELLAGAAEVDLTPPPGMPKAGYSSNATDGVGFRDRLRARIVHLRAGRASVALVHTDLLGGSSLLQHLVARRVAATTDVPLSGVWIGATHTHAAPGQFLGSDFYNRFASNRAGLDPAWTRFLVDQIADGVVAAVTGRAPAVAATGTIDVWGATRNRSLPPHARNPETDDRTEIHRRYAEVEPRLHLLRVDRRSGATTEPLAASAVYSIHGTGVSHHSDEYTADLWTSVVAELRRGIGRDGDIDPSCVVIGAMEGAHGDMTPAMRPGRAGHVEAARVGRDVGAAAARLHAELGSRLSAEIDLGAGFREVDLQRSRRIDGVTLPRRPAVGAALAAGAKENETPVIGRLWPFRAGSPRRWRRGAHGAKRVLLGRLFQRAYFPLAGFPRVLPLQVLRIGDALLVGAPFEITMAAGRRFERAIEASIDGAGVERVVLSSVVNEYVGYCTTAEEYELQYYEGGHTLYGPNTQPFVQAHLTRLATELTTDGAVHDPLARRDFDIRLGSFLPAPVVGETDGRRLVGPPRFVDLSGDEDAYWEQSWEAGPPATLRWHEPLVRIEASADGGSTWTSAADDGDGSVAVRHDGDRRGRDRYTTRWYRPEIRTDRVHRFVLAANARLPELVGDPFD